MLWNSLVPKDKILQGNTCLKMIYKSLEYYYISINFSPKVQLLSYNGKLNQIVLQTKFKCNVERFDAILSHCFMT